MRSRTINVHFFFVLPSYDFAGLYPGPLLAAVLFVYLSCFRRQFHCFFFFFFSLSLSLLNGPGRK